MPQAVTGAGKETYRAAYFKDSLPERGEVEAEDFSGTLAGGSVTPLRSAF